MKIAIGQVVSLCVLLAASHAMASTVLVAEYGTNRVLRYNVTGTTWTYSGVFAEGAYAGETLQGPHALAEDTDGNIIVAESTGGLSRFLKFDASGTFLSVVGTTSDRPDKMALGADGNIYFTSPFSSGDHDDTVRKLDVTSGSVTTFIDEVFTTAPGVSDGELDDPRGIAIDRRGDLYVADRHSHRVRKFDGSTGAFLGDVANVGDVTGLSYDAANDRLLISGTFLDGSGGLLSMNLMELTDLAGTPTLNVLYSPDAIPNALDVRLIGDEAYWMTNAISGNGDYIAYASDSTTKVNVVEGLSDPTAAILQVIPTPAALPAGLLLMGVMAARRRRHA